MFTGTILKAHGYQVTMVQNPLTSSDDGVAAGFAADVSQRKADFKYASQGPVAGEAMYYYNKCFGSCPGDRSSSENSQQIT